MKVPDEFVGRDAATIASCADTIGNIMHSVVLAIVVVDDNGEPGVMFVPGYEREALQCCQSVNWDSITPIVQEFAV